MGTMEIEITIGGISYNVEVEIEDNHIAGVEGVEVYDGCNYLEIDMTTLEKNQFYERYEDELNDAYQTHMVAQAEMAAEERWELETER